MNLLTATRIYDTLVIRAEQRHLSNDIYVEKHHVIPRCISKRRQEISKELQNLTIKLTAKEHYVAHHILTIIYKEDKEIIGSIWRAFHKMCVPVNSQGQERNYIVSIRNYERARFEASKASSIENTGRVPWNKGKKSSDKTRLKISKAFKGRRLSDETKLRISKSKIGIPRNIETKEKLRLANIGRHKGNGMKGKVAWNRGIPRTEELKEKLRQAYFKRIQNKNYDL